MLSLQLREILVYKWTVAASFHCVLLLLFFIAVNVDVGVC